MATGERARGARDRRIRSTALRIAIISVVVVAAMIPIAVATDFIEWRVLDALYRLLPPSGPDPQIALIDADESPDAYDDLGLRHQDDDPDQGGCSVPRRAYASAATLLRRWGAKVIVFDLMFLVPCRYEDGELADAFHDAGNVVIAATTKAKPGAVGFDEPVSGLGEAAWGVGSPAAHQPNETVRSIPLLVEDKETERQYVALSLLAYQCFVGASPSEMELTDDRRLVTGGRQIPVLPGERMSLLPFGGASLAPADEESVGDVEVVSGHNVTYSPAITSWNTMIINWMGPKGTVRPHVLSEVLQLADAEGRRLFNGKAVIIGKMEWDEHWTAVGAMPGPEVQANAVHTLISGEFVRPVGNWATLAILAVLAAATVLAVHRLRGSRSTLAVLALLLLAVVVGRELLLRNRLWMHVFYCEASVVLAWGISIALQSDVVTGLLSRFVPAFLGEADRQEVAEVRTLDASILWSDIRSFTGISEQMAAEDMLRLLHSYHSAAEDIITKYGGTIVKTPGDAILAVFWRELDDVSHATCAVRAGRKIVADLPALARDWEAAGIDFDTGVGINAGSVAMGLVGKQHLEPTVIGDAVNVAQRLETLTKELGYSLIFSESVRELLQDDVPAVCLDDVTLRGRKEPIRIYGVVGSEKAADDRPEKDNDQAETEGPNET